MTKKETTKTKGTLEVEGNFASITFVRYLAHPPTAVWSAITDPAEVAQWFMASLKVETRTGGQMELVAGPGKFHSIGKVLAWEPMRVFEYEYKVKARTELPQGEDAIVRWELSPSENGTRVQVTYKKLTKATSAGFLPGMHVFLDRLEAQLDHAQLPTWEQRFPQTQALYPELKGLWPSR